MRLAAFKQHVEQLACGNIKDVNAALGRAMQKKEVKQCSKAWDTFSRNCNAENQKQQTALRHIPPAESLPPVA
jgi:hypothetical protein